MRTDDVMMLANPAVLDLLESGEPPSPFPGAFEVDQRRREAIDRLRAGMLLDEYRSLPVGDRLAASYWHLRATVSPLAIAAHQRRV